MCFQNHRTTGWKCLLEACQSASSYLQQDYCQCQVRLAMALSCCTLEASKAGGAGTSLGSLLQRCTNLLKKNFPNIQHQRLKGDLWCCSPQQGEEDAGSQLCLSLRSSGKHCRLLHANIWVGHH